jgi:hypothetical protein
MQLELLERVCQFVVMIEMILCCFEGEETLLIAECWTE